MAPDIPIEHAVHDPGSVHVRLSYRLARRCPPDRLRSLFDYLKALDRPVTFVSFPDRLYQASEALVANGGTLQPMPVLQTLDGGTRAVAININTSAAWTDVEIDWGSVIGMFDMLASPAVLDVLRAGARILAAGSGELALHSPNTG
ncbi:MAG TPA: hypothetical protein VNT02_12365, partial [Burkholderiales bacterium]|nr:hypothetical protein [Burkholderiales bacterium]